MEDGCKRAIPFHKSLRARLLLPLIGVLSLAFAATALIVIRQQNELMTSQARTQADDLATTMLSSLQTLMMAGDALYVQDWLTRVRSHPDLANVAILRRDGTHAFQDLATVNQVNDFLGTSRFSRPAQLPVTRSTLSGDALAQVANGEQVTLQQDAQLTYLLPVRKEAQCNACHGYEISPIRGILRVTISTEQALQSMQRTNTTVGLVAAGALLAMVLLGYLIIRGRILGPVDQLMQATGEIAAGNMSTRIDNKDGDEIAVLGDAFNTMSGKLERTTVSKRYVDQIIEALADMLFVTDDEGIIVMTNPAVQRTLGYAADELAGKKVADLIHGRLMNEGESDSLKSGKIVNSLAHQIVSKSGEPVPVLISISMLEPHRNQNQLIYAVHDITRQKVAERQVRLAAKVMDTVSNGIIVTDAQNRIQMVNPAFTAITGYEPEDVIGQDPRMLQSDKHDDAFFQEMWDRILSLGIWDGEIWNCRKDGEIYPQWQTISCMRDDSGEISHFVCTFLDISEQKRVSHKLEYLANHDLLTGLPNRKLFLDRIEHALEVARRNSTTLALLFIDIDGFKPVNDHHGHDVGDTLLKAIAERLGECVRESDTVARIGGDEFTILMESVDDFSHVQPIAEKVLKAMRRRFEFGDVHCQVGASIGISFFPDHSRELNDLVKKADEAMYRAKRLGRNRICVHRPDGCTDKDYVI